MELNTNNVSLLCTMGVTSSTLNFIRKSEQIPYLSNLYDEDENKYVFSIIYTGDELKALIIVEPMIKLEIETHAKELTPEVMNEMVNKTVTGLQEGYKAKAELEEKYGEPPPLPDIPINWGAIREQQITAFMKGLSKFRIIENFIMEKHLHPFLQPLIEILKWEFHDNEPVNSEDEEENEHFDKYK